MSIIERYAWGHAAQLTDEAQKRKVLAYFIERVRAGKPVNSYVLNFIADGIEKHLAGKKPWAGTRGMKKLTLEESLRKAFPLWVEYQRIMDKSHEDAKPIIMPNGEPGHALPVSPAEAITFTAENLNKSEDTVRRAIDLVQKESFTFNGRPIVSALKAIQELESYLETPEGKLWLKTPAGKRWKVPAQE